MVPVTKPRSRGVVGRLIEAMKGGY
jgi:hypothetical protein